MPFSHSQPAPRTNEDVFFEYYPRLLEWATQITRNDRAAAEDLVHDFYLRVIRIARPIDGIELREQYLFTILRNLYYAQFRRAGHDPINDLSIVDYDSVEQSLAAADRRALLYVRDHLRKVCRYACERKSAVRSASVLILRFFHGYYPTELMKILKTSRSSVDKLLKVARAEARLYLERPEALQCISSDAKAPAAFSGRGESTTELFLELREAVLTATEGECFDRSEFERLYGAESNAASLTTQELSHLVSCRTCLESVNEILQLPALAERSPENGINRDGPGSEGGSGVFEIRKRPSKKGPDRRKLERRARELFEHRPDKLQVAVDGEMRASQKVSAETNELHLKLARKEEPSFIEVFSEQGFCLAYLQVENPASADQLEQIETVPLSDNRSLTVTLTFAAEVPIIHVLYVDPVMSEDAVMDCNEETSAPAPSRMAGALTVPPFSQVVLKPKKWLRRRVGSLWTWVQSRYEAFPSFMNPMLATAMVCAVAAVVFLVLSFRASFVMKPEELIGKATTTENAPIQSGATGVIVQAIRIQTPHRKLERTLYRDLQARRRPKDQKLSREDAALRAQFEVLGVLWNDPLSAASFRDWHDHQQIQRDQVARTGKNLLTLTTTTAASDSLVMQETLTVRENDFHPVERTIKLRDAGTIEIAELNYAVLPWGTVRDDWFELPPGAISDVSPSLHSPRSLRFPQPLAQEEIDAAELEARSALAELKADTSERIRLAPGANGVQISGIVATDERKRAIESRLRTVPHVIVSIATFDEMERDNAGGRATSIQASSSIAEPSPLARFLLERGRSASEAAELSQHLMNAALKVKQHANAIHELLERFGRKGNRSAQVQSDLVRLLDGHKAALLQALDEEQQDIARTGIPELTGTASIEANSLLNSEEKNAALCVELTSGSDAPADIAKQLLPELASIAARLHTLVLRVSEEQNNPPASTTTATVPLHADKQR